MFTCVIVTVDDKIRYIQRCQLSAVSCSSYGTCKLLAWWLYIQSGLPYSCNTNVGVSCMQVGWIL